MNPNARIVTFLVTGILLTGCGGGGGASTPSASLGMPSASQGPPQAPPPSPQQHSQLIMTTARASHTATLLRDGKVLIAGGTDAGGKFLSLTSAELYDPSSGTFTPTGDMTTARSGHTATLLANGKVLIAGGGLQEETNPFTFLASAEIYDPSTGTFAATGNMISSSGWSRSTLLPDGRAFIAADGNAEMYNPATATFALTAAYSSSSFQVDTATQLSDGTLLVVGCAAQCGAGVTDLFDPKTDTFSPTGPRLAWDTISTATLLLNGTVLFVEGNDSELPDDAEIYNPASGTFNHIGYTDQVHEYSTATRLPDGTVLIAGGQLTAGAGSTSVEVYDPATGKFSNAADLIIGRHLHTATLLPDGTVLIAGGYNGWPMPTASAEIYKK